MRDEAPALLQSDSGGPGEVACPCCGARGLRDILAIDGVPTNSCILLSSAEEARAYPRGDIRLAFCDACGFFFNRAFDLRLTEYSGRYEETQTYSQTFSRFHRDLAARLIDKHGLRGGRVLEIGCGKGEFLALLAELGDVGGVGVDPGVHPERLDPAISQKLEFVPAMFEPSHVEGRFDMIACKMTLEHIPDPFAFVSTIRKGVGDRKSCVIFFQVPDAMRILDAHAFEDVYYEHCAYFSAGSLARLFRRAGFEILNIEQEYGGQYLTLEAVPADGPSRATLPIEDDLEALKRLADGFAAGCARTIASWRERIEQAEGAVALWGSGSKAVAFLAAVDGGRRISHVTDINPNRHGHFMPATAQEIVAPAALGAVAPALVVAMNRVYLDEIGKELARLGIRTQLTAL